jgi:hypothetical protein
MLAHSPFVSPAEYDQAMQHLEGVERLLALSDEQPEALPSSAHRLLEAALEWFERDDPKAAQALHTVRERRRKSLGTTGWLARYLADEDRAERLLMKIAIYLPDDDVMTACEQADLALDDLEDERRADEERELDATGFVDGRQAVRIAGDGGGRETSKFRPVGIDAETLAFSETPGGSMLDEELRAPTGVPTGRPRVGTKDPARAKQLIEERAGGRSVEELRGCLGRGRKNAAQRARREELAQIVRELRSERRATPEALAGALGCDPATIRRLVAAEAERSAEAA